MLRGGSIVCVLLILFSCANKKTTVKAATSEEESSGFNYEAFDGKFKTIAVPYQLTDTALLANTDTSKIAAASIKDFIPDSIKYKIFGKETKPKYTAIGKIVVPKAETYFIVKATGGSHKAAFLLTFDKKKEYSATLPFLVADADASTTQVSTIDKSYTISRNISRFQRNDLTADGKDVYVYNSALKQFTLIMTDLLDDKKAEFINPIDTFAHTSKFTGDYIRDKKDIVSVRNGRRPNELRVFVHFEKDNGDCIGELKGDALLISSSTAVYRQGGDPCVLQFAFTPSSVTLKEEQGCGTHRGVKCLFENTYPRKKETKPKATGKKPQSKKKKP